MPYVSIPHDTPIEVVFVILGIIVFALSAKGYFYFKKRRTKNAKNV